MTTLLPIIRPSARPLFEQCPSSQIPSDIVVDSPSDAASLGTLAHRWLARRVRGCERGEVPDEVAELVERGLAAINQLGAYSWSTEVRLESDRASGTADALWVQYDVGILDDWKTGWSGADCSAQLGAYAYALLTMRKRLRVLKCGQVDLRFGRITWITYGRDWIKTFAEHDDYLRSKIGVVYNPGEHCGYCKRRLSCVAYTDANRQAVTALTTLTQHEVTVDPTKLANLWPATRLLKKTLEYYEGLTRAALKTGPIPLDDGTTLELVERNRSEIDPAKAWAVLESNGFTLPEIARCLTVSKGEIETVASEKAPRGGKGAAKLAIAKALTDAGAITQTTMSVVQHNKQTGEQK